MGWKDLSYGMKFAIWFCLIYLILFILLCFTFAGLLPSILEEIVMYPSALGILAAFLIDAYTGILNFCFELVGLGGCSNTFWERVLQFLVIGLINLIIYFIAGWIIGWFYGKIKENK